MRSKVAISLVLLLGLNGISPAQSATLPNAPQEVTVVSSSPAGALLESGSVTVTWTIPSTVGSPPVPISYSVAVQTKEGVLVQEPIPVPVTNFNRLSYSTEILNLKGGTSYDFVVTANTSEPASKSAAAVPGTPITVPDKPTKGTPSSGVGTVTLNWTAPSNTGGSNLTAYTIKNQTTLETITVAANATTKTINTTVESTYLIQAVNASGGSAWEPFVPVTPLSRPEKPTSITASANATSISVAWVAPLVSLDAPITSYKMYLYDNLGSAVGSPTTSLSVTGDISNVAAGTYTVKVSAVNIAGDGPQSDASLPVTIAAPSALLDNSPVFTPTSLPDLVIGGTQSVSATVPSAGVVTITAIGTPAGACTYSAGTLTAVSVGTCSVRATSPATSTYAEAAGTKTFSVTKTLQTITFASISNQPLPGPLVVSASSTSGLTVSFAASGNCTVTGTTVSFTNEGSCSVTATQAGSSTYAAATAVVRTFSITATVSSGGSGGGGSGGGGGFAPGPTPVVAPSPSASPSASPTPTPSASATAKPNPSPTPSPSLKPSPSPTSVVKPTSSPAPSVSATPSNFRVGGKVTGAVRPSTLISGVTQVNIPLSANFQPVLPFAKQGETISMVIKDPKGKTFTAANVTVKKNGSATLPSVKFSVAGKYTITIKVGSKTKIVYLTAKK